MGVRRSPINSVAVNSGFTATLFASSSAVGAAAIDALAGIIFVGTASIVGTSATLDATAAQTHVSTAITQPATAEIVAPSRVTRESVVAFGATAGFFARQLPVPGGAIVAGVGDITATAVRRVYCATSDAASAGMSHTATITRHVESVTANTGNLAAEAGIKYNGDSFFTWPCTTSPYADARISFTAGGVRVLETHCVLSCEATTLPVDTWRTALLAASSVDMLTTSLSLAMGSLVNNVSVTDPLDSAANMYVQATRVVPTWALVLPSATFPAVATSVERPATVNCIGAAQVSATAFCIRFHEYPVGIGTASFTVGTSRIYQPWAEATAGLAGGVVSATARTYYPWALIDPISSSLSMTADARAYSPWAEATAELAGGVVSATARTYYPWAVAEGSGLAVAITAEPRVYNTYAVAAGGGGTDVVATAHRRVPATATLTGVSATAVADVELNINTTDAVVFTRPEDVRDYARAADQRVFVRGKS